MTTDKNVAELIEIAENTKKKIIITVVFFEVLSTILIFFVFSDLSSSFKLGAWLVNTFIYGVILYYFIKDVNVSLDRKIKNQIHGPEKKDGGM